MDEKSLNSGPKAPQAGAVTPTTRRRRNGSDPNVSMRYFLSKNGASSGKPDLGQEFTTEGDALIAALQSGQPFFVLTTWSAVAEMGSGHPIIVKQPLKI
ncbi:MAG TPA: hypothetical protein VFK06_17660 [Candidatus Angelobacter sp.]|nr:hypothetical protein [Candidatus Angelobacter sp.]